MGQKKESERGKERCERQVRGLKREGRGTQWMKRIIIDSRKSEDWGSMLLRLLADRSIFTKRHETDDA